MILSKHDSNCLREVSKALLSGNVVIIPTDTVYGFSGIVPSSDAKIRLIKGRDEVKPFIQLIASPEDIEKYSSTEIPKEVAKHMPGPLTVIVKNKHDDQTTAFRCPDDPWLQSLITLCGAPLYSTSTNRSGCPILFDINEMDREFSSEVFCIVDGELDNNENALPSTIVDISKGKIKVIRQGHIVL